jgi:L-threonylcarbamoyladenylate synthase
MIITMKSGPEALAEAAALLRQGKLVAFPTETVYGLGANALDGRAVARIFEAKGRPSFNPLIVHVVSAEEAEKLAVFTRDARRVAASFWPGPLTLILPRAADCPVSELCSAGLPTLALRVPSHKTALELLRQAGVPVAAPSANKSGEVSPTTPLRVAESLGDAVDFILAEGSCSVGLESTVLDLSEETPTVLRPGAVTAEQIAACLGQPVGYDPGNHDRPKSPGQLLRHYAPRIPVRLNAIDLEPGEALLAFGPIRFMGVRGGMAAHELPETMRLNLSPERDLQEAAANLFRMLHELDRPEHRGIAVMAVPEKGIGVAINDRLRRAAAGSSR